MSDGYYRIDALRPDGRAGTSEFVRGANKEAAEGAFRAEFPDMAEWELTITRVKREEFPVEPEIEVLVLPPVEEVVSGEPGPELDADYSAWSASYIREQLLSRRTVEDPHPRLLVQAPTDTIEEGNDSRDLVTLGVRQEVVVIDPGVR